MRNWGALIALIGGMLIYGAFSPPSRPLILTIAGISKLTFIALVLAYGRQYIGGQAGMVIAIDSVMVMLSLVYLFAEHRSHRAADDADQATMRLQS